MGICDQRVVIVTGAGGGLGAAHARVLAGEGAAVLVNDINTDAARAVDACGKASKACFSDPQSALDAAVAAASPADRIIVCGSFFTVGGVLKHGLPRLNAKHLGGGDTQNI